MRKLCAFVLVLADLAAGQWLWTPRKLVGSYPNWNYWWLNVRLAVDRFDTLYCAVMRYNYSNSDPEHDLYVLNSDGDTVRVVRPWHGFEYQPIVQDARGRNLYIGQPLLGMYVGGLYHMDAGVTDDSNCVLTTNSQGNDSIYFTMLGPNGARLVWRQFLYYGDPWVGRTSLALDPRGWLHMATEDGMERLLYGRSSDRGASWQWDTLQTIRVMSHCRVVATPDTCVHFVFRTWTGGVQLRYLKLRPDGSVAVDNSVFSQGSERWDPNVAVDSSGNLRVVYVDDASQAHNLYYTVLRGDLDAGGQSVPDSVLTLVPDTVIQTDPVRLAGPKICVDSRDRTHVVFEQGVYGSGGDKYVYHICEQIGQAAEEVVSTPAGIRLWVQPNPIQEAARVSLSLPEPEHLRLGLYDATGRLVRELYKGPAQAGMHVFRLGRSGLSSGSYFLLLDRGRSASGARLLLTVL
ncbi:MAG: hypothetical protein ABIK86_05570 [candidate division WOR-3 bacterium]